jgi:predicted DNA-binding transcriptional regulator AlpA
VRPDGAPFAWRGISAFRLLEMEAAGRARDVDAYLTWTASQHLNVVRVLAMAKHLFELSPETGLAHLDTLLTRAAAHGLFVEVVALADTASYAIDPAVQVERVARICSKHSNALLEIANEPYHATQLPRIHERDYLRQLLSRVPPGVPAAVGAGDFPVLYDDGTYATAHFPRSIGAGGWGHVRDLRLGGDLLRASGKPVINDEPIGAGQRFEPGRRDDSPERFRAAALASRLIGLGATFHYEGGLQARIPAGREVECFHAWQEAWTLVPGAAPIVAQDAAVEGGPVKAIHGEGYAASFVGLRDNTAWVLVAGTTTPVRVEWGSGWAQTDIRRWAGSQWCAASRRR